MISIFISNWVLFSLFDANQVRSWVHRSNHSHCKTYHFDLASSNWCVSKCIFEITDDLVDVLQIPFQFGMSGWFFSNHVVIRSIWDVSKSSVIYDLVGHGSAGVFWISIVILFSRGVQQYSVRIRIFEFYPHTCIVRIVRMCGKRRFSSGIEVVHSSIFLVVIYLQLSFILF